MDIYLDEGFSLKVGIPFYELGFWRAAEERLSF